VGFPIRTSADRCLVDGSPQLFAVTHVLHRFLAPRHPPLALRSLERTKYRTGGSPPCTPPAATRRRSLVAAPFRLLEDTGGGPPVQRCSCLLCSSQGAVRGASSEHRAKARAQRERRRPAPPTGGGCTEVSRFRLLQNGREDKCVVSHERVRPKPTNLLELGDEPTSAPTGCPDIGWSCDHRRCGMDSLERR
jgi:hypothetical protein